MNHSPEQHLNDLRISPIPILIFLASIGYAILMVKPLDIWFFLFIILVFTLWIVHSQHPNLSRWLTICLFAAVIPLFSQNLNLPSLLILLAFPGALAVAMQDTRAGVGVAVVVTTFLAAVKFETGVWLPWDILGIALVMNWGLLGLLYLVYRPIRQHYHWLDEYAATSKKYMQEAQSRMVELNYALFNLANSNRQLQAANERMAILRVLAEDAQQTKTIFLSKVSHEFRTPLNMIIGLVELMVKNQEIYSLDVPPEMDKDLQVVLRNCQHLSGMINDVLDLTRIETGQVTLHKEWIKLEELFEETAMAVRPLVEKKSLELVVDIQKDLPEVYCDRTRIRQVIFNLVSNAARFTETGGIHIQAMANNSKVEVCVSDTGLGIIPEDLEHIFEPFFQGSRDLWRGREGSGLGLSISQQFIKLHEGRLWAESHLGVGSQFHFELPITQGIEYLRSPGQWIRDDWVWREEAFKAGKLPVVTLPNKPLVMMYDQTGGLFPELSGFTDQVDLLQIKDISGVTDEMQDIPINAVIINSASKEDLVKLTLRAQQAFPNLPVIGCTINRREHRAIEMGAAGYLIKPVSSQSLESAIQNVGHPIRKVLIVDDDPEVQHLFKRMIWVLDNELKVESAYDGIEALERLAAETFDLILLDVIMQEMDGWQVLEKLKQDDRYSSIPTYIVTAQDPEDRPTSSDFLLATISQGFSPSRILRGTLEFSKLLMTPESETISSPTTILDPNG